MASLQVQLDGQQVEILGRNLVKAALIEANLEVATPERDNGIDLIAFRWSQAGEFRSCPVQIKAASGFSFGMDRKYERIPGLIMAFVMRCRAQDHDLYAMTYRSMVEVGEAMGWTGTDSWKLRGNYSTRHPSPRLLSLLAPHRADAAGWAALLERAGTSPGGAVAASPPLLTQGPES